MYKRQGKTIQNNNDIAHSFSDPINDQDKFINIADHLEVMDMGFDKPKENEPTEIHNEKST